MVVEWCDQVRVLSHAALGCFLTHCGWNSVLESVASGVPMVCVPQISDQRMNAWLVECEWRVGVRAEVASDGVLHAAEVKRRVEEVMRGDARGTAAGWKRVVVEALEKGGSSDRNLMAFVEG
jgi:UDP:flavonoid glycosyltransferase YjiC (YdhE family)